MTPEAAAERYWRYACLLSSAHLLGWTWPPSGRSQRTRVVGHWGCNPGIAWIVGHLAARWDGAAPLRLVVGTGHASSFTFAHTALAGAWDPRRIEEACAVYGMPGGTPSELVGEEGVPFAGGELGPALAVSQALAVHQPDTVACVVGDGECETPVALAALAHAEVVLGEDGARRWVPCVNANGARMGGASRFTPAALERLLRGFGYDVEVSDCDLTAASEAAAAAFAGAAAGQLTAWVSVTDKGWPAPSTVAGAPYRGHRAHKAPSAYVATGPVDGDAWAAEAGAGVDVGDGRLPADVVALAGRVTMRAAPVRRPAPLPAPAGLSGAPGWRRPMAAVDTELARRGLVVYSPDEAASNGLTACAEAGLVIEVLAEEICAAWTWGAVEAGRPAVFVTYEAFAPLAGTLLAQYAKMTSVRPPRGTPPFLVVATSLGWANTPTHQNTDLAATLLARELPGVRVVYPVGATSAAARVADLASGADGVALLVCSKQHLLDLPDLGGAVTTYRVGDAPAVDATIVAVGDVCVTESVAAAALAASVGVGIEVLAVVEPSRAGPALAAAAKANGTRPTLGTAWCAPGHIAAPLWKGWGSVFPVQGYRERWDATATETLRANRLDRGSLLAHLAEHGVPALRAVDGIELPRSVEDLAGVTRFDPPALVATRG